MANEQGNKGPTTFSFAPDDSGRIHPCQIWEFWFISQKHIPAVCLFVWLSVRGACEYFHVSVPKCLIVIWDQFFVFKCKKLMVIYMILLKRLSTLIHSTLSLPIGPRWLHFHAMWLGMSVLYLWFHPLPLKLLPWFTTSRWFNITAYMDVDTRTHAARVHFRCIRLHWKLEPVEQAQKQKRRQTPHTCCQWSVRFGGKTGRLFKFLHLENWRP